MAKTWEDLKTFVGSDDDYEYDSLFQECFEEAQVLVDKYVGTSVVPEIILDRSYLEVGADLFNRRSAPNGVMNQQYATVDGIGTTPYRISRDPMSAAYKILGRWVTPW